MNDKYLIIIDLIESGGAEKVAIEYYRWLQKKGEDVTVFVLYKPLHEFSGNVIWGLKRNISFLPFKAVQQIFLFFKLWCFVLQFKPKTIFSLLERSNVLNVLIPFKTQKIISVRNQLSVQYKKIENKYIKRATYAVIRFVYNRSRKIIAVSENVKDDLIKEFKIKPHLITVINNGVDRSKIDKLLTEEVTDIVFEPTFFYIITIGRLSLQKAQWKLISALNILVNQKKMKHLRLIIIGEGEFKERLIQLIESFYLNDYIQFRPPTPNPYKYLINCQLFALPSLYEGFPNVLAEAIYLKKPFVGSEAAIPIELFNDFDFKNNVCYKNREITYSATETVPDDEIQLADLMGKVITNNKLQTEIQNAVAEWNKNNSREIQFERYYNIGISKK